MLATTSRTPAAVSGPTEADLVREVRERGTQGISAPELVGLFVQRGSDPRAVQEIMQRALDKGTVGLGSGLRLIAAVARAA